MAGNRIAAMPVGHRRCADSVRRRPRNTIAAGSLALFPLAAPLGGGALIIGWLLVIVAALFMRDRATSHARTPHPPLPFLRCLRLESRLNLQTPPRNRPPARVFPRARTRASPMPKRTDIKSILIIGAGPIIIGQACEFDYSGTQACKALKEEGYRIILVNSNPATIMTDPDLARRHLYGADHPRSRRQDHREGAPGRAAADHGRPDRAQLRAVAAQDGRARKIRRRDDRRRLPRPSTRPRTASCSATP